MDHKYELKGRCARVEVSHDEEHVRAGAFVEIDFIDLARKYAEKSDNTVDDYLVGLLEAAIPAEPAE